MNDPGKVKPHLDQLFNRFDRSYLAPDPLAATTPWLNDPGEAEVACLIAALFAYGRADLIQRNVDATLTAMAPTPARFCENFKASEQRKFLPNFKYRFNDRADLVALVKAIGKVRKEYGSLLKLFLAFDDPAAETILPGLTGMVDELKKNGSKGGKGFSHLLSDPRGGSSLKRLNLFMRWMVRKDDVDPGPWNEAIDTARLVIPLDVHVGRIARRLGMLDRATNDWKAAIELTRFLKEIDPADPARYDFAICSYGKLGYCVKEIDIERCESCDLSEICTTIY